MSYLFSSSRPDRYLCMTLESKVWYGIPSSLAREWGKLEIALRHPKVHTLGLIERIASRLTRDLDLSLSVRRSA